VPSKKLSFTTKTPPSPSDGTPPSRESVRKATSPDGSAGRALRRIQTIQYADFIRLCKVDDPNDWAPNFRVAHDGVWVVPPSDDADLLPSERAVLSEHPSGNLSMPALTFPCSLEEFHEFILWSGLNGCVVQYEMEKYLKEKIEAIEPHDKFVERMKKNGKPELEITKALLEKDKSITNYRLGILLPANPGTHIDPESSKQQGKRLKDKVKKEFGLKS
jgi:hypothetical protein